MGLVEALGTQRGDVVSLVGAGGKTTAALRLADELARVGEKVLFTTTTKILEPIPAEDEYLLLTEDEEQVLRRASSLLESYPKVTIAGRRLKEVDRAFLAGGEDDYPFPVRANKLKGIPASLVDRLAEGLTEAVILVEADGARHRSLKAPADYEPVVPRSTTLLVPMAALDILGQPLTEERVHRARRVAALTGIAPGQPVTAEVVATVLSHPQGGLKGLPFEARAIPILNQMGVRSLSAGAQEVAHLLLKCERIKRVVIASLRAPQPILEVVTAEPGSSPQVAAIVLAAGASWRMGQPKQLLPLGEGTMLQRVIDTVLASPADAVIVVLGHRAAEVAATIDDWPVQIIVNEAWEKGLSSSVKAGLRAAGTDINAALFVLADQPAVSAEVMAQLVERYRQTRAPIVVPVYQSQRGNPVLFDRSLFAELMEVEGDQGGRDLINRYRDQVEEVEVASEGVLLDINTLADYQRLMESDDYLHLSDKFSAKKGS